MTFYHLLPCLALLALTAACGGTHKETRSDSTAVHPAEALLSTATDTAVMLPEYLSEYLRAYALRGPVTTRSEIRHDAQIVYPLPLGSLYFDEEGHLADTTADSKDRQSEPSLDLEMERDSAGFYSTFILRESDGTTWKLAYTETDSIGHPIRARIDEEGPGGTAVTNLSYSRYGLDSHRNWTVRRVDMQRTYTDPETGEQTRTAGTWKETCTLTYRH